MKQAAAVIALDPAGEATTNTHTAYQLVTDGAARQVMSITVIVDSISSGHMMREMQLLPHQLIENLIGNQRINQKTNEMKNESQHESEKTCTSRLQ